jgi:TPR repeat protein
MAINFPAFPPELWVRIAQYGGITVCTTLCQVSKVFESIVKDPSLEKTWKREVYNVIDGGPRFGLLLDLLLEGKGSWREIFLSCIVVQRFLAAPQSYSENESFRENVLKVAQNTIDPLILLESHLDLDVVEEIDDQIVAMLNSQNRTQHPKTYETLFLNLEILHKQQPEDSEVCYYLSECYFRGIGIKVNPEKAFAYVSIAARLGCVPACCNLGAFYAKGFGVEQNDDQAIAWLEPLTTPQAKFFLGMIKALTPGFEAAFHLIEEAAIGGHTKAQYLAGLYYLNGYGEERVAPLVVTEIDPVKSFNFFNLSAHQGYLEAISQLGNCYLQGFGTQKCFTKGFACLKLASRYGSDRYCSTKTFFSIESQEDQQKMWQFLAEGAKSGGINADMSILAIAQKSKEWDDCYRALKKRKLS